MARFRGRAYTKVGLGRPFFVGAWRATEPFPTSGFQEKVHLGQPAASSEARSEPALKALLCGAILAARFPTAQVQAQGFTIDGGGGTGGVYSVSGTIGQPDAGTFAGGTYKVEGGVWSATALQTPGAPRLLITRSGSGVIVSWPRPATGFLLDSTPSLGPAAVWSQVPFPYQTNATDIFITVPAPVGNRFYRLRKP